MSKAQYQQYIPQFLLRNFAHPYEPKSKNKNKTKNRSIAERPRLRAGDPLLHAVELISDDPKFIEMPVRRTFGQPDMYKDDREYKNSTNDPLLSAKQWNHVDLKLGKLEHATSRVFRKIVGAHTEGVPDVQVSDREYATLRKFVFIMRFRSTLFFEGFNHRQPADYTGSDKDMLLAYMHKKGILRPVDVWLETLVAILDLEADAEDTWARTLGSCICGPHAMSAELLMHYMYPVICTPSKPGEEFILSEHAYALHEGPTIPDLAMIEYHLVCVVAPRLALLLRSTLLPEAEEDRDEVVKKKKEKNLARCLQQFPDSSEATSMFHDLPVTKPQRKDIKACSSPTIQNDRGVTSDMPSFRGFSLALFGLDSKAIQNINSLILDNASDLSMIVFRERSALRLALEFYLTRPICTDYDGMKTVGRSANDPTLAYLRKL
jgi:hypothetical protein